MEELLSCVQEYRQQLQSLQQHLQANPGDADTAEVHAELTEALASAEEAYAACCAEQPGNDPAQQQQQQQPQPQQKRAREEGLETADTLLLPPPSKQQRSRKVGPAMHPANLYAAGEPDFAALAAAHPALTPHLIYPPAAAAAAATAAAGSNTTTSSSAGSSAGRPVIDFTSWDATKELTAALLKVDFGVTWDLPPGQLVPPVPNRANYIHWVADLLALSSPPGVSGEVTGLDIGCGANLIYCLLGASIYGWRMVGVDVTDIALSASQALVQANPQLQGLLEVRQSRCAAGADLTQVVASSNSHQQQHQQQDQGQDQQQQQQLEGPLMGVLSSSSERFHFCMCNPPFFESLAEANQNPNTACGGTAAEMVTPGGELAFVRAMIADSRRLRGRVHWYSSMCGKKASMKVLRQELHSAGVTTLRTTDLVQGKTSRWAIAWSFTVPHSTANMPLPRAHQPQRQPAVDLQQQQQQQPAKQQRSQQKQQKVPAGVSFTVEAPAAEGRRVLQALGALLVSLCGAQQLHVDTSKWTVSCRLPVSEQIGSSSGDRRQQQQEQQEEKKAGDGGCVGIRLNVFQQRKAFQVVAKAAPCSAAGTVTGPSTSAAAGVLAAAVEKVKADMALMWDVCDG